MTRSIEGLDFEMIYLVLYSVGICFHLLSNTGMSRNLEHTASRPRQWSSRHKATLLCVLPVTSRCLTSRISTALEPSGNAHRNAELSWIRNSWPLRVIIPQLSHTISQISQQYWNPFKTPIKMHSCIGPGADFSCNSISGHITDGAPMMHLILLNRQQNKYLIGKKWSSYA